MAGPKDYYKILEIDEHADAKTIKSAYRRMARKYHPDVAGKGQEERFKAINEAYQVLSDSEKRSEYDRLRRGYANRASKSWGPGFHRVERERSANVGSEDWTTLFDDLFGDSSHWASTAGGAGAARSSAVPEDEVSIGLEQVATGSRVAVTVEELEPCSQCQGGEMDCSRCGGLGRVTVPKKFEVNIPAGIEDGTVLRIGEHARIKVKVRDHPRFGRQGKDLRGRLRVAVPLAAVGGEVEFKPLTGDQMAVKIPPHTNTGKVLRLRGLGLPERGKNTRGDLLLEIELMFPEPFTEEDDRLYQALWKTNHDRGGEVYAPR